MAEVAAANDEVLRGVSGLQQHGEDAAGAGAGGVGAGGGGDGGHSSGDGGGDGESGAAAVRASLERLGVFDEEGTQLVTGFFKDSLPRTLNAGFLRGAPPQHHHQQQQQRTPPPRQQTAAAAAPQFPQFPPPKAQLAILRVDGDLYESTIQALHSLYPALAVGGHVIVDDFTDWVGRRAVRHFRAVHGIGGAASGFSPTEPLQVVWHDGWRASRRGVWWTKQRDTPYNPLHPALKPEHTPPGLRPCPWGFK